MRCLQLSVNSGSGCSPLSLLPLRHDPIGQPSKRDPCGWTSHSSSFHAKIVLGLNGTIAQMHGGMVFRHLQAHPSIFITRTASHWFSLRMARRLVSSTILSVPIDVG